MPPRQIGTEAEDLIRNLLQSMATKTSLDQVHPIEQVDDNPDFLVQGDTSKYAYLFEVKNDFRRLRPDGSPTYGNSYDAYGICNKNWNVNRFPLRGSGRNVKQGTSTTWVVNYVTVTKKIIKAMIGTYPSYDEEAWNALVSQFGNNLIWAGHGIIPPGLVGPEDQACQDETLTTLSRALKQFLVSNES